MIASEQLNEKERGLVDQINNYQITGEPAVTKLARISHEAGRRGR